MAPVVVKPDIDSNHEFTAPRAISINDASGVKGPTKTPPSQNGSEPMKTAIGHTSATAANASRSRRRSEVSVRVQTLNMTMPRTGETIAGTRKAESAIWRSSNHHVTNPQTTRGTVSAMSVQPRMRDNTSKRIFYSHLEPFFEIYNFFRTAKND